MDVAEHASKLGPGLIAAYRAAHFRVDGEPPFTMIVDVPSPSLRRLMRERGHAAAMFITGWNPGGKRLPRVENELRQRQLREDLRAAGFGWVTGAGSDPTQVWPDDEASVLVLGVDRAAACRWGLAQAQNAVLWAGDDAVPRLLLLRGPPRPDGLAAQRLGA